MICRTHIDIMMLGKCNPLSQRSLHDAKIQITHAEHYRESDNLFLNKHLHTQCILTINHYKEWSFDRICKVQLSDENEILMNKSMLERYRKYNCCVFIEFEYIKYIRAHLVVRTSISLACDTCGIWSL